MKKYKFKLEALLKMRKLKEEQCKMEIGRLQIMIRELEVEIAEQDKAIEQAYTMQEEGLENGMEGVEVRFHPYYVNAKRAHIKELQGKKDRFQQYIKIKYNELNQYRAAVKVIEKLKEKEQIKYKNYINKKISEQVEEQVQNWRMTQSKEA